MGYGNNENVIIRMDNKNGAPFFVEYKNRSFGVMVKPTYDSLMASWDSVLNSEFTKHVIGKDESNAYDIYKYERGSKKLPTVFIVTGLDGLEYKPALCLIEFMREVVRGNSPYLNQLLNRFRWVIIPYLNPWGLMNNSFPNYAGLVCDRSDSLAVEAGYLKTAIDGEAPIYMYLECHSQGDTNQLLLRPHPNKCNIVANRRYVNAVSAWRDRLSLSFGYSGSTLMHQGKGTTHVETDTLFAHYILDYKKGNFPLVPEVNSTLPDNEFEQSYLDLLIEIFLRVGDGLHEGAGNPEKAKILTQDGTVATSQFSAINNRAYFVRFYVPAPTRVVSAQCFLSAASNKLQLGVYTLDGIMLAAGYPSSNVVNPTCYMSTDLAPGWYYAAIGMAGDSAGTYAVFGGAPAATFSMGYRLDACYPLPDRIDPTTLAVVAATPCIQFKTAQVL